MPVSLTAVGDVFVDRPEPAEALSGIAPLLEASDVTFANFEGVLTDAHAPVPGASDATIVPVSHGAPLRAFDVLSLANNHALDAGHGGLADTIDALTSVGATVVGAGPTLAAASRPAIVERGGTRVAFVAATSVFPMGADVVLGHHHHLPRGVELLGGKPVFYGLGHAAFDQPRLAEEFRRRGLDLEAMDDDERAAVFGEWAVYPRCESPSFPFHPLYRR